MRKKILVCDDDADLRRIVASMLRRDYDLFEAGDGEAALKIIEDRSPDLVLLDVTLPGMSGLETLTAYHPSHPDLPTIMLTGNSDLAVARQALQFGASEYVTKPFDPDVIKAEVRRALEDRPEGGGSADGGRPWRVVH